MKMTKWSGGVSIETHKAFITFMSITKLLLLGLIGCTQKFESSQTMAKSMPPMGIDSTFAPLLPLAIILCDAMAKFYLDTMLDWGGSSLMAQQ
jgi:hypothetical protein